MTSEQSFGSGIVIGGGQCVVPLDPFSLVGVGIYKESFSSKIMTLVELAKTYFENKE